MLLVKTSNNLFFKILGETRPQLSATVSVRDRDCGECHRDQYCIQHFLSRRRVRKHFFTLYFDVMSDDPWIMRQDPLTQPPLCPSAALKLRPV